MNANVGDGKKGLKLVGNLVDPGSQSCTIEMDRHVHRAEITVENPDSLQLRVHIRAVKV